MELLGINKVQTFCNFLYDPSDSYCFSGSIYFLWMQFYKPCWWYLVYSPSHSHHSSLVQLWKIHGFPAYDQQQSPALRAFSDWQQWQQLLPEPYQNQWDGEVLLVSFTHVSCLSYTVSLLTEVPVKTSEAASCSLRKEPPTDLNSAP